MLVLPQAGGGKAEVRKVWKKETSPGKAAASREGHGGSRRCSGATGMDIPGEDEPGIGGIQG